MIQPILKKKMWRIGEIPVKKLKYFQRWSMFWKKKKSKEIDPNLELKEYIPQENIKPKK